MRNTHVIRTVPARYCQRLGEGFGMNDEISHNGDQNIAQAPAELVRRSASTRMVDEVNAFQRHTALSGERCTNAPGAGEVPTLEVGVATNGCTFRDGHRGPGSAARAQENSSEAIELNTSALYQQALSENVRIDVRGRMDGRRSESGGSGVIIGRDGQRCVIATNSHVVSPDGMQVQNRQVVMPNGRSYPATVPINDRANDRAALVINTGRDTDEVCRPARVADSSTAPGPGWVTGFPLHSTSMYVSPAEIMGRDRPGYWRTDDGAALPTPIRLSSHVERGNSGGPVYNAQGEVQALVFARGTEDARNSHLRLAGATPFNASIQRNWMERITRQGIGR